VTLAVLGTLVPRLRVSPLVALATATPAVPPTSSREYLESNRAR
jgi:hypothetical protein